MGLNAELDRRYANVRRAMEEHGLDALVVSGSEYTGFEGSVTYLSGFQIVHRYAYVVVPADGEPFIVFPTEARYVGEHGTAEIDQVFHERPGAYIADRAAGSGWKRVGVYGLDYVMAPRDYRALDGLELVPFDVEFDLARAVKSEAELASVRDSVRINERGFEIFVDSYAPGKSAAEVMAAAEEWFVAEGCGRLTMNMVLTGDDAAAGSFARPEFKIARRAETLGRFLLPSLEIAGPGMHWVEVSRAVAASGDVALGRHGAHDGGLHRVLRRGPLRDASRCELPRPPSRRLAGVHRARVPPRPRDRALDRDDDDRVSEGGGGRRDGARGGDGLLDAPARDRRERRGLPVHAGDVARHVFGRRAALAAPDAGLRDVVPLSNRARRATIGKVSWPWLVLLVAAATLVVAVETPRLTSRFGADARRERARKRRKKSFRVITPEDESDEFIRSVQRDLESLPTIEETDRRT